MAKHFLETVEPMGFKAFLVGVDREACALYKKELDKHLPGEYSRVVYSRVHNDGPALKEFYLGEDEEKKVRKAFIKKGERPKILIVTEKLLTGYDAPMLYCMYLDKPMRDHVLLQAIARVNRPYEDEAGLVKKFGFVLDFVGIFEKLEKALAFDSDVVSSVIQNIDVLKSLFSRLMHESAPRYLSLGGGKGDKGKERAIEFFKENETREEFFKLFRQIQDLYEIISPDASLRPFIKDYQLLAELYGLIRNAYFTTYVDRELTDKTRILIREHSEGFDVELPGAIQALGPKELAALRQNGGSGTTKILNLRKILGRVVKNEGASKPFLLPIGERAEALAQAYEDRQLTTQQALEEFLRLAQQYVDAEAERKKMQVDDNTFAIYTALKPLVNELRPEQAKAVNSLFANYPDFRWDEQQGSKLRAELYKMVRPMVGASKMIEVTNTVLRLQRI